MGTTPAEEAKAVVDRFIAAGWLPPGPNFEFNVEQAPAKLVQPTLDVHAQELVMMAKWVADLQRGQTVNCVYCGHNYGPVEETPVTMADVLYEHIAKCPKHPLALVRKAMEPVADWYGLDHEDGPVPLHEAVALAVTDLVEDRSAGLKLVAFLRKVRVNLPKIIHTHPFLQWLRKESDKLHEELLPNESSKPAT